MMLFSPWRCFLIRFYINRPHPVPLNTSALASCWRLALLPLFASDTIHLLMRRKSRWSASPQWTMIRMQTADILAWPTPWAISFQKNKYKCNCYYFNKQVCNGADFFFREKLVDKIIGKNDTDNVFTLQKYPPSSVMHIFRPFAIYNFRRCMLFCLQHILHLYYSGKIRLLPHQI